MANIKISQLTAKGTPIAANDLVEISESNGAGGYVTKSVTGANILASKQDTLVSGTNIKTINGSSVLGSGDLVVTPGVASLTATSPVVATGTSTPVISLASGYGDTQNPYASKTANHILAAPNGAAGVPTFRAIVASDVPTLNQSTTGNAATVTTNANLTGPVTSTGNATAIANGAISNAMLANGAVANLSGTNTGDTATNSQYSGLVSNATHTGDATGNVALTVKGINGTLLSNLNTGILKNTTGTGVPSIAVAADFPILNQNTTGTAGSTATLATARTISTNGDVLYTSPPFDGSANVLGTATLASIGVAGTYTKVTTDAKGRVTVGANLTAGDVPTLNQNTTGTAANVTGIVAVANGGTGTATPSLVAGTNVTITGTFPNQTINSSGGAAGVTAVTATTPVVATGTTTPVISLATNYGDTQNPYSSKTANHILAAPNGTAGVPTFRAIVGADIPTLNQNTTGTSATVTSAAQPTITSVGTLTGLTVTNPIVGSVTGSSGSTTGNAATVTTNANLTGDITSIGNATSIAAGVIVNADISATAGITDNKLADIDSAGKVKNSATTATASNTASTIVLRDASNNFSAGTITANLTGTASGNLVSGGALGTPSSGSLLNTTGYLSSNLSGIVPVAKGGTGTATPSLVAGTNITITGSFPNQTITAAGGGGGVTQIVAGTNVTISPAGGTGVVTVNASGGGGGTAGGPHLITQYQENYTYGLKTNSAANTTCTTATNRMTLMPFVPNTDFLPPALIYTLTFMINVTIGANVNCKIVVFSDSGGMPLTKLFEGATMSCTTTGIKFDFTGFGGFTKGTKYWIGTITSGAGPTLTQYSPNSMIPVSDSASAATNWFLLTTSYAYASVPATVNPALFTAENTNNCPAVFLSIIGGE